ncbi:hypothetical protein SAMN05421854_101500 [Amycolatopsis rubida]|uniref:Uncharacterized protein n=1 Tax=Amycolatopsis rubida TaxID=112413 RepID=A0A1I5E521_9PSEU|nr:hypothetical protein SAMN05421854_101500 [Amycolatopsis rubida]
MPPPHRPDPARPARRRFDPHRPRRADATVAGQVQGSRAGQVSILIGLGGPMPLASRPVTCSRRVSFDPHRPRRADATTAAELPGRPGGAVSILIGPGGPMPLRRGRDCAPRKTSFDPHRPRRADATAVLLGDVPQSCVGFDPHRPRRADATVFVRHERPRVGGVSILIGLGGPMPPGAEDERLVRLRVSILIGPGGPMPLPQRADHCGLRAVVSILIGPGGPMPRADRNRQPPPTLDCFDPHRPRRADATAPATPRPRRDPPVSILIGPGGPMPRVRACPPRDRTGTVSILIGPGGPMPLSASAKARSPARSFDPHRPRRADATLRELGILGRQRRLVLCSLPTCPGSGLEPGGVSHDASGSEVAVRTRAGRCGLPVGSVRGEQRRRKTRRVTGRRGCCRDRGR